MASPSCSLFLHLGCSLFTLSCSLLHAPWLLYVQPLLLPIPATWLLSVQPLLLIIPCTLAALCTASPAPYYMHRGCSLYSLSCSLYHAPWLLYVQPLLLLITCTLAALCTSSLSCSLLHAPWLLSVQPFPAPYSMHFSCSLYSRRSWKASRKGRTPSRRGWTAVVGKMTISYLRPLTLPSTQHIDIIASSLFSHIVQTDIRGGRGCGYKIPKTNKGLKKELKKLGIKF
jgi:hypothetical protein